jgi:hypothetical protein
VEVVVTAGGGQTALPSIIVVSTRKGAKGMKKDQKRCLRHPAAVMNNSSVMEKLKALTRSLWHRPDAISSYALSHPRTISRKFLKQFVLTTRIPSGTNSGTAP